MIAIVTGTPGAGKTSIVEKIIQNGGNYTVVSAGTEMLNVAKKEGLVQDRDELRKLSAADIKRLRLAAFKNINEMAGNIIIDTHASVKSGARYVLGFTIEELDALKNLSAFVYIDATAHEILLRRATDNSRNRDIETMDEIDQQREINISLISAYAAHKSVPIYMIRNEQGKLDDAIEKAKVSFGDIFNVA